MKVGIFSPYFQTFGGGERYVLTVAEYFLKRGDRLDIFWSGEKDVAKIKDRFDIDLSRANFVRDIFHNHTNLLQKLAVSATYDLIFFLSDGSIPFSLAGKNILHFQQPFHDNSQNTLLTKVKLLNFGHIVCNSHFTKSYIDRTYGVKSEVIYPPVDVEKFLAGKKENIILSVGRFFGPSHPKKQEVLIATFKKMTDIKGWRLILIGAVTPGSEKFIDPLRKKAANYPITLITDSSFKILRDYYSRAKIYWHATGFGQDLEKYPERAEHFGITTVEAMAAGCVPIVFAGGGQKEIVVEGRNGFFWSTTRQLKDKTLALMRKPGVWEDLSKKAIIGSGEFSKEKFFKRLDEIA